MEILLIVVMGYFGYRAVKAGKGAGKAANAATATSAAGSSGAGASTGSGAASSGSSGSSGATVTDSGEPVKPTAPFRMPWVGTGGGLRRYAMDTAPAASVKPAFSTSPITPTAPITGSPAVFSPSQPVNSAPDVPNVPVGPLQLGGPITVSLPPVTTPSQWNAQLIEQFNANPTTVPGNQPAGSVKWWVRLGFLQNVGNAAFRVYDMGLENILVTAPASYAGADPAANYLSPAN